MRDLHACVNRGHALAALRLNKLQKSDGHRARCDAESILGLIGGGSNSGTCVAQMLLLWLLSATPICVAPRDSVIVSRCISGVCALCGVVTHAHTLSLSFSVAQPVNYDSAQKTNGAVCCLSDMSIFGDFTVPNNNAIIPSHARNCIRSQWRAQAKNNVIRMR